MDNIKVIVGVLAFLGVVIGACLQYVFTRHIERQKHSQDLRSKAYMDYLKCVCELAQFRPKFGSQEQKELASRTGDAKARICLYGSNKVISAFSKFEQLGATMNTLEQRNAFTSMVAEMRADSGTSPCDNMSAIQDIILGVD